MALVLKKWQSSSTPDQNGNFVHLVGRKAGFFSWFLSLLGVDPTTEVEIKDHLIMLSLSSLSGREKRVIPLKSVCSAFYGYTKPWKEALVLTVLLAPVIIGLILGPLYYFLNKRLTIGVVEMSGQTATFAFKRSVIEGRSIAEQEAYQVIEIVRLLIERKTA